MLTNNPLIIESGKKYAATYEKIYRAIKKAERIAVVAHAYPDYDALGTSYGLYTWLKENFPQKDIRILGENHGDFTPTLYPVIPDLADAWFDEDFLGIAVDTANMDRIGDTRIAKAKTLIKIDHHPPVEQYGNINLVVTEMSSTSELIANFILTNPDDLNLSKESAIYLFSGIAGDSGRFKYSSTSEHTFAVASALLATGIDLSKDVYNKMYVTKVEDLRVVAHILANFTITEKGVAYYVLSDEDQKNLGIDPINGKNNVNLFSDIEGVEIWLSITEEKAENTWRVSIRSKEIPINGIAAKYDGGGHNQASGAKINSIEELPALIADLEALIK